MALGDTYNNNKKDYENKYSPTVYSKFAWSNTESKIDPSRLSPTFWNGMLKLAIAPLKPNSNPDIIEFDHDNAGAVYLTHIKAKMLADEITVFLQNMESYKNQGVASGSGLISISNGKEFTGSLTPCLIIRNIDDSGKSTASFLYEFKKDYHYSIRNYNEKDASFDKFYNDTLEIEMLRDLLIEYHIAMSGALAYSVMEFGKYDNSRTNSKLDAIADKLGVVANNSKKSYSKSTSAFDRAEGRSYNSMDLDDIENEMKRG